MSKHIKTLKFSVKRIWLLPIPSYYMMLNVLAALFKCEVNVNLNVSLCVEDNVDVTFNVSQIKSYY